MRYDIRLKITYNYGMASEHVRTLVRMVPPDLPGAQRILRSTLIIDPTPSERHDSVDFFGNAMTALGFHGAVSQITYSLQAEVERLSRNPALDLAPRLEALPAEIAAQKRLGADSPHHYRGPSARIDDVPEITQFAAALLRPGQTAAELLHVLGHALHETMTFDAQATDVDTSPQEAFAKRHGVCQDFSHVMIAGLRGLGIPARYVSGFVRTEPPEGQARLEGADAMHAWVSAWCGAEAGWIEFDPTNACAVNLDHVVVGYGRDYSDVSPVKGVLRTSGMQFSTQAVDVIPLD